MHGDDLLGTIDGVAWFGIGRNIPEVERGLTCERTSYAFCCPTLEFWSVTNVVCVLRGN